MPKFLNKLKTP